MSCKVIRNSKDQITKVQDSQGIESALFSAIASHPLVIDTELALNIYKNSFLPAIGEDATWQHRTPVSIVEDYKEALKDTASGESIEIGLVNKEGKFYPIISTTKSSNKDSLEGFITSSIESGVLSSKKTKVGPNYLFEAQGKNDLQKAVNTEILHQDAKLYLGKAGVVKDGDTFTFERTKDSVRLENKKGENKRVKYEDIDMLSYDEIRKNYTNPELVFLDNQLYQQQAAYRDTSFESTVPTRTEKELQISLLNLLSKLGVKTLSITDYVSKYRTRNGVAPSATALADIANQVIAYTQGKISIADLTEETSHFIVEAMPKESTENVLRNIHKTDEWVEFSDQYRELYRGEYSAEELEEVVRREVLGKVLKNSIIANFSLEDKSGTQQSIIAKVKELFNNFFEGVYNLLKPQHVQELEAYLSDVNAIVKSKDTTSLNTNNFKHNKYRLYSTAPSNTKVSQINKATKRVIAGLENQIRALSKQSPTKVKSDKIQRALVDIGENYSLSAIADVVEIAKGDMKYLRSSVSDSEKHGKTYILSSEENTVYHSLKQLVAPALQELQALTKPDALRDAKIENNKNWEILNREIKETLEEFTELSGEISAKKSKNTERIVDEIVSKYDFSADTKDNLMKWAENAEHETNIAHSVFGTIAHSRDGSLRTLGYLLRKMNSNGFTNYVEPTQKLQNDLRALGFDEKFFKEVLLDGSFILNDRDFDAFYKKTDEIFVDTYKEVVGNSTLTSEEILQKREDGELELTKEQEIELREKEKGKLQPFIERPMLPAYYAEYEERVKDLSPVTRKVMSNYLSDISKLKSQAIGKDGKLDWTSLTSAQRDIWQALTEQRKKYKDIFDKTGNLKEGLEYERDAEGFIQYEKGSPVVKLNEDNKTDDAIVAFELIKLDGGFRNINEGNEEKPPIPEGFIEDLQRIENEQGRAEAIDYLYANAYIGMTSDYWEKSQGSAGVLDRLKENGEVDLYNEMVAQRTFIKNILKQNSSKNQPSEVNGAEMTEISRETIKNAQETLDELYRKAIKILPSEEESESTASFVTSANDSYVNHVEALGIKTAEEEFDMAKDHMTNDKRTRTKDKIDQIDNFGRGKGKLTGKAEELYDQWLSKKKEDQEVLLNLLKSGNVLTEAQRKVWENGNITEKDFLEILKKMSIRDSLLPYYKRTTSESYDLFSKEIKDSNSLVSEVVANQLGDVEITPNYSFYEGDTNKNINPNYDKNFKGGMLQPKKSLFSNSKFQNTFGEIVDGQSATNPKGYQAYQKIMDWYEEGISAMDMPTSYNRFQKPQVREGELERISKTIKDPKRLSLAFKEFFTFTEDDMVKGDTSLGAGIKTIPKRYVYKIEDQEDVSNELFYSMNLLVQQGHLRQARVEAYGDIMTVMDSIKDRTTTVDKENTSTSAYKMANSAVDSELYDVREIVSYEVELPLINKKVDLAQVARRVLNFIKLRNLGLNFVIPLTSYASAQVQSRIETVVGEFMDTMSYKLGSKEYRKIVGESMKEFGEINHKAKLNVMGQYFGAFDIEETFKNSSYSKIGRLIPKTAMGLHTVSNFPIYGKNMLATFHNYRIVDGQLINWNEYRNKQSKAGKNIKEAKEEWKKSESDVIYNYMSVEDGQMKFNEAELSKKITNFDKNDMVDRLKGHLIDINQRTDGQMNKNNISLAKRHAIYSYATTHRDWFSLAISHRFHSRIENLDTGKLTEGSYLSVLSFAKRYVDQFRTEGPANLLKGFKKAWETAGQTRDAEGNVIIDFEAQQVEQANIKRVGIEWAILQLGLLASVLISQIGDNDEDDPFLLKAANLLAARVANETASQQLGLGKAAYEVFETPIIGLSFLSQTAKITDLFDGETIKSGSYKDMSKRERYILRTIPGFKSTWALGNLAQEKKTYDFYNKGNVDNLSNPLYYFIQRQLEEDK
ncbi:structural protein [Cellulophaga phage phi17:2_18]|uniref:Structural protein n=2 Tax=Lightbulbvirus Cba172 TaxID=1918525 RepID=R9ZWK0_9CAUD|nr:virion structural protein [Cellulophaga phage phi17:2]AGO47569.1 structural protein [Cellulophaga phage phi17:2]ALO80439.1 structural protein [Cellulophaga phage phi17:2_18]